MRTADDRRSGRAAETAVSCCLGDFFFPSRRLLHCAPTSTEQGATGSHYSVLQGPTHLAHIRQVQSAPSDTCTCDFSISMSAGNGRDSLDSKLFIQFAHNLSTPQVFILAQTSGKHVIRLMAELLAGSSLHVITVFQWSVRSRETFPWRCSVYVSCVVSGRL